VKLSSTSAAYPSDWSHTAQAGTFGATPPQPCSKMTAGCGPSPRGVKSSPPSFAGWGSVTDTVISCLSAPAGAGAAMARPSRSDATRLMAGRV
jgi:hypothetical protein